MNPSDEIKSRLDIVDVLRDYIPLKAAGLNFRALCPFHNEKSPSFVVSPEKQIWHCFGCGKGGDVFAFVMEMEGLNFVETLRSLAPRAGVDFKQFDYKVDSGRNRLLDILELSAKYYHWVLTENKQAEAARDYLEKRKLTQETIDDWKIGYSPDSWDDLYNFLKSKGYKDNEIFSSGMSIKKEGSNRYYNRFRGRIMFPINDANGNAVAFTARVSPEKEATETMGKYINSPQTSIYDKSKILFGLDKAKTAIKRLDSAILVEGQMDVITAHQAGFSNVVASSGTALTREQVNLLKRYTTNISLAFDMDKAGEMAAERGMREAMAAEMKIRVITIPSGKDPDECIKNNPDEWQEAVDKARPMMEYIFEKSFAGADRTNIYDLRQASSKLLPIIAKLGNKMEQDFWLRKLSQATDSQEDTLRREMARVKTDAPKDQSDNAAGKTTIPQKQSREEKLSESLIALIMRFPALLEYIGQKVQSEQIVGTDNQSLYKYLTIYYNRGNERTLIAEKSSKDFFNDFMAWFREINTETNLIQADVAGKLALLADNDFYNHDIVMAKQEAMMMVNDLKKSYLDRRKKEVQRLIFDAEQSGREDELSILMDEFRLLTEEKKLLGE